MKRIAKYAFLATLLCANYTAANAQGVVVYKKDGTSIKVPYEQLDRIDTYNYDDEPGISGDLGDGEKKTFTVGGVTFNMIPVEHGTFQMGKSADGNDATTVRSVTISKDYYIGETEVTQALWKAVTGYSPTSDGSSWSSMYGLGDNYPAYYISWNDVQTFITKLNQLTGQTFRMPTEAEWEFAAKGGNKSQGYTYSGSNTIGDVAWYTGNSGSKTHPVATKASNELGLYDMSGNVWEWCADWYDSTYYSVSPSVDPTGPASGSSRVRLGGSWNNDAAFCRTANRGGSTPTNRYNSVGFRLALSPSK